MRILTSSKSLPLEVDCLIVPIFEQTTPEELSANLPDGASWVAASPAIFDLRGKALSVTMDYGPADAPVSRMLAVGLGDREDLDLDTLRSAIGTAIGQCVKLRFSRLACSLELVATSSLVLEDLARETALAALLSIHCCTGYRSCHFLEKDPPFSPESFALVFPGDEVLTNLPREAEALAAGITYTRELVNGPSNVITPERMAEEARSLAERYSFTSRILGPAEMQELGMGALLAVAQGSRNEPRLAVLEAAPEGKENEAPLILIGKGVTFDTGGISLKPSAGMQDMKGDMAGAAAVLGAFEAIGLCRESLKRRVIGIMPCAENMPGGAATRPGDVITTMSGKTVEIINTDAEGRLLLCDAITYAQQEWKPAAIVDIATLTGACVVALGSEAAAVFANSVPLREEIVRLGDHNGDTFWPMPLWKKMREKIKSHVADMANVGNRDGGSLQAAMFLNEFVDKSLPWAHLDIAGPGCSSNRTPTCPEGGTGFGVRTLFGLASSDTAYPKLS